MRIVVPKECAPREQRVALVPESCKKLIQAGYEIAIEAGAGEAGGFPDDAYSGLGVQVASDPAALVGSADLVLKVNAPATGNDGRDEVAWMRPGAIYLGSLMPLRNSRRRSRARGPARHRLLDRRHPAHDPRAGDGHALVDGQHRRLQGRAARGRRARQVLPDAHDRRRHGARRPRCFVIGAGVAGLQAIATARRLGANVVATDVRPEVKEQIESVGAKYVGIELAQSAAGGGGYASELSEEDRRRQNELLVEECAQVDVVITTALIGGVFAPRLISADTVRRMKPGSVIVDLAADGGGNCELSKPGETRPRRRRHDPRAAEPARHDAEPREPALLAQPDGVRPGVHEGQGVPARPGRRHPAGRAHHPRRRR